MSNSNTTQKQYKYNTYRIQIEHQKDKYNTNKKQILQKYNTNKTQMQCKRNSVTSTNLSSDKFISLFFTKKHRYKISNRYTIGNFHV